MVETAAQLAQKDVSKMSTDETIKHMDAILWQVAQLSLSLEDRNPDIPAVVYEDCKKDLDLLEAQLPIIDRHFNKLAETDPEAVPYVVPDVVSDDIPF